MPSIKKPPIAIEVITSFFYLGKIPFMPGTMGSLGAIPLILFLKIFPHSIYTISLVGLVILALFAISLSEAKTQKYDNQEIVIDEVIGMMVATAWLPPSFFYIGASFILFRFFDILKPFPISWLERKVKGAVGVILDDVIAGFFTQIILQFILIKFSI